MDPWPDMFPPYGLRIASTDLELRILRDDDVPELMELKHGGIAEPGIPVPFLDPWHEKDDAVALRFYWSERARFSPEHWHAMFVVRRDGTVVGCQHLKNALDVRRTGVLSTSSWLGVQHHRQGIGTRMRQLVALFAFDHLGATRLRSNWLEGNPASAAVSRRLGYVDAGTRRQPLGDSFIVQHDMVLTPEAFVRPADEVIVEGADRFRRFVGLA